MFGVKLRGLRSMMSRVMMMAVGDVGMMRGEMMVACLMMLRCFAVMTCGVLVVFRCFEVMLGCLLRHGCCTPQA
jgi:hypothetical protein